MVSNRIIKIDLNKKTKNVVQMVQGDTNRKLTINVFDSDEPYLVDGVGGGTIYGAVYIEKPDGTTCGYDTLEDDSPAVTGSGNTLTVYFVPQATTAHGWAYMTVSIFDDEGVELNTFGIDLFIDKKATATISADYWNLKSIEGLTAAVEGLTQQMVRSVNHATADTNGNVTLLPWQIQYNGVVGGQQVGDVEEALDGLARMQSDIIDQSIKDALINALSHVAWVDEHGQDYVDALELAMRSKLLSISAVFNQGAAVIYDTDDLDTLRQYLTVTALYSDTTTKTVTAYTLSGTLEEGTSIVTVTYGGKTTTINVNVTHRLLPSEYQQVEYIESANTGNGPYLRFPFTFPSDFVIKAKTYQAAHISSSACPIICTNLVEQTYTSRLEIGYGGTANRMYYWSSASASVIVSGGLYGSPIELEAKYSSTSPYKEFKVTTAEDVQTATNTTANYTDLQYVLLFAMTYNPFAGRIYYMQIVGANQNPILNLVPCYRKADNVIGMYDTVGGQFYTNAGTTGTFTKGGDV